MESIDLTQMHAGYDIIKRNLFNDLYDDFHQLICQEIVNNNIHGVNALIRWIDVVGYFPNYVLLFNHALQHGSYEMFLMIYYICLFWPNDGIDDYNYLNNIVNQCVDYELKLNFINHIHERFGKMDIGMDNIALKALTEHDDLDALLKNQSNAYEILINGELFKYNIDMQHINRLFYESENTRYTELSP